MSKIVRGSVEEPEDAIYYMAAIAEKFEESEKAEGARLHKEFHELKYDGNGSVREHIMHKVLLNGKLRDLRMGVSDAQIVHEALIRNEAGPFTAVNLVEKPKWKKKNKNKVKQTTNFKVSGKPAKTKSDKSFKYKCFFCKKMGHMKECSGFKAWMIKKGFNKEEGSKDK
ncbi:PREDICTED: uncharacterized protein LOC101308756 [Fragaria vesca subsp. vesca]